MEAEEDVGKHGGCCEARGARSGKQGQVIGMRTAGAAGAAAGIIHRGVSSVSPAAARNQEPCELLCNIDDVYHSSCVS